MSEIDDDLIYDATAWLVVLTQHDADLAVDGLLERVIRVLRRDPRMPVLTAEEWRILFADAAARSRDELGDLIEGKGDIDDAAEAIAEELAKRTAKPKRKQQAAET